MTLRDQYFQKSIRMLCMSNINGSHEVFWEEEVKTTLILVRYVIGRKLRSDLRKAQDSLSLFPTVSWGEKKENIILSLGIFVAVAEH